MAYDLEMEKAISALKEHHPKRVLIQLPDGLKPKAEEIRSELSRHSDADIVFWSGSCFGACDIHVHVRTLGFDLILTWGHSPWRM